MQSGRFNTLVISDLHLGEDLTPSANAGTTQHVDMVERQLIGFFRHYSARRLDGRPWRVVVNGDMIDFMAITILPDHPKFELIKDRDEDREFGAGRSANAAIVKLELVLERHWELFRAMSRYLARGNRIEFVCGNHDAELHFDDVQHSVADGLVAAFESLPASQQGAASAANIRSNVAFHRWFFWEPGVVWIEHGHQYDECCSFDFLLNPLHPQREVIVANVDTSATRYMTNYVVEADPHSQEDWSAMGYVRWAMGLGVSGLWRVAKAYSRFARSLLAVRKATLVFRGFRRGRRDLHDQRLSELSERWGIERSILMQLDGLHRTPVSSSIRRLMRVLMLDKLFIFAAVMLISLVGLFVIPMPWSIPAAMLAFILGGVANWWNGRGRVIDPGAPLKIYPERIRSRIDADYVVFGHTHDPVVMNLEGGGCYFNTGTWVPSGKPGLLRAFTHVRIQHTPGGTRAEMCQWRDNASRPFSPSGRALITEQFATAASDAEAELAP